MDMEQYETIGQELVKCVLVGDTAAGKTRLVCARALNARVSLRQLLRQHIPTVWAIDQYRMYKEVLERSMAVVDGVQVSLRLWDTFGDHEKDRRFAYGRSDIILLCYSIGNKNSLMHCKTMWFPEIKRFCPDTPVILVGCKNDLRFLCKDPTYLAYCRDRSPCVRPSLEGDLVMPEQGRAMASEFGVPYYETSVFTYFGVNAVFENAIRSALIARRNQRFWMTNLKHVQLPMLQAPYCPPKKELSEIEIFPGSFPADMKDLVHMKRYPDLVFLKGLSEISAHKFVIAAVSSSLGELMSDENSPTGFERPRLSLSSASSVTNSSTLDETECLLKMSHSPEFEGFINSVFSDSLEFSWKGSVERKPNPLIEDIWTRLAFDDVKIVQMVVQLNDQVSLEALRCLIHFIYTGEFSIHSSISFESLQIAANLFENLEISQYVDAWYHRNTRMMADLRRIHKCNLKTEIWEKCLASFCCDVVFELEDGEIPAHKALLCSRSEVMKAMFTRDFVERRSQTVTIPDVKREAFLHLLEFLYTDSVTPPSNCEVGLQVLQLANRLCLTRLVNFVENVMITDFTHKQNHGADVMDYCLRLLEPAQLHNIEQLAQWCLVQLATHYDLVCRKHSKLFKELDPENRQWISQYRWPPVWYVKDFDYYQKQLIERYKLEHPKKKGRKRTCSGCLCFPGKSSRRNLSVSEDYQIDMEKNSHNGPLPLPLCI